jgi:hypothetical protein
MKEIPVGPFHAKDGPFFTRKAGGAVEVQLGDRSVTVDYSTWASVVASVSAEGETAVNYQTARWFHMGPTSPDHPARTSTLADPAHGGTEGPTGSQTTEEGDRGPWHSGRAFSGTAIEDACPCPQAPCGLVDGAQPRDSGCVQHAFNKTIRQSHRASDCPSKLAPEAEQGEGGTR